jgi:hypothetical protein
MNEMAGPLKKFDTQINLAMTGVQKARLAEIAKERGVTASEVVRDWIDGGQAPSSGNDTVTGALDQIMERFDAIDRRLNTVEGRQKITMIRE